MKKLLELFKKIPLDEFKKILRSNVAGASGKNSVNIKISRRQFENFSRRYIRKFNGRHFSTRFPKDSGKVPNGDSTNMGFKSPCFATHF